MDLELRGKRALVLGSSRGLGHAVAEALAAEGAGLILCGRDSERLQTAVRGVRSLGVPATSRTVDLADAMGVSALLESLSNEPIDILVNNTGGPPPGAIASVTGAQWRMFFQGMAASLFEITAHIVPGMRERGWGRVINIVSSGVVQPIPISQYPTHCAPPSWRGARHCPPKSLPGALP